MISTTYKVISILSMGLFAISGVLFVCSFAMNPWDNYLSLNKSFHIGLWSRGFDPRIVLFNNAEYGPYRGSLIGVQVADEKLDPPLERQLALGDSWGIYYRDLQWADSRLWTLMVSLWYPIILFGGVPLPLLLRNMLPKRASRDV